MRGRSAMRGRSTMRGTADRDGRFGLIGTDHMSSVLGRRYDAFADSSRGIGIGRRQNHEEFLAAEAGDQVRLAGVAAQDMCGPLQNAVTYRPAEFIVDRLEIVEVRERNAQRPSVTG